ncbi:TPA: dTMP kinase [Campylobacter fetus subsp. venerealis]|uniref:Thymidylate kinase n=2 Tax=Campylobacter fetus TaxID=196 RepID=A0A5L4IHZ2_CAMFE|nr:MULTISPECIES: dTMP kinase [Campylobacter]OCS23316.1 thymidylate kinase [Campylobacter fetus subsp. venerealis cfvi97/532]OCS25509.1 thymidylate kinase [Campylobacter fetus subsp. venerealis cfvB10]OCS30683.1 thymidylate kinase [Campylobacter fetus subsp. venerealis LMG 6570 = CCUG 33900]OCS40303.1 thymidylate kinase [Campylobacter fetus subsp. venerealis cfvi02/298]AHE94173.1 dTMP kinase [Campylobacter fetus subsp. venerealis cfvi03/293]
MLVNFEGVDGVGKSTQISLLKEFRNDAVITKEPGGTEFGLMVRDYLLKNASKISNKTEIFLFLADRAEHYEKVLKPNYANLVLNDRSFVSGMAYAMANDSSLDIGLLLDLNKFALNGDLGDKFVFLKADEILLRNRLFSRGTSDEIEMRGIEYLMRVQGFMSIILSDLKFDVLEIDASLEVLEIQEKIRKFI